MNTQDTVNTNNDWHPQDFNQDDGQLERQNSKEPNLFDKALSSLKDFASFSSMLRIFGAIAMLISMSMFLLQGWSENNDFERFCTMIAQTILLGMAGFGMIKFLKEKKGARLFFGLALVSVTTNFTTLGAMLYSVLPLDNISVTYPNYALWQLDSPLMALLSIGIGLVFLVPISMVAFSVLARPAAKQLTFWFVAMNALLLIPVRETAVIMMILGIASIALVQLFLNKNKKLIDAPLFTWRTHEGRYARLILFVTLMIMLVRSSFYEFGVLADLTGLVALYAISSYLPKITEHKFATFGYAIAMVSAILIGLRIVSPEMNLLDYNSEFSAPLFVTIFGLFCAHLYRQSHGTTAGKLVKIASTSIISLSLLGNHIDDASTISTVSSILFAGMIFCLGVKIADRFMIGLGFVLALIVGITDIGQLIDLVLGSGWMGFAIGGVGIIVLASLLERYGAILKLKLLPSKDKVSS